MKRITVVFGVCLILILSVYNVSAEIKISYDDQSHELTVIGDSGVSAGSPVAIHVFSGGNELPDSEHPPIASKLVKSGDGAFKTTIEFSPNVKTGRYKVLVSAGKPQSTTVILCDTNSQAARELASRLDACGSPADFADVLSNESNTDILGILSADNPYFSDTVKLMYNGRKKTNSAKEYVGLYTYMSAAAQIKNTKNVPNILKNEAESLGGRYEDYDSLDENIKKEVDNILLTYDFSDGADSLDKIIAVAKFRQAKNSDELADRIEEDCALLGTDMSKYSRLPVNERHKVPLEIYKIKDTLYSTQQINDAFTEAVKNTENNQSETKSPIKSSSGGGKSGKTVGISQSVINASAKKAGFTDIQNHYASEAIEKLSSQGIINGYNDNTFRPNNYITRAEFCKIAVKAFGITGTGNALFDDVKSGDWYYECIYTMNAKGYAMGDGKLFYPNKNITRQDAAVIIARIINAADGKYEFEDNGSISDYAIGKVGALAERGYMVGDGKYFRPTDNITRAETAVLINRICTESEGGSK